MNQQRDDAVDEPMRDRSISRWTAEFADAGLETEFLHHHLEATARRIRTMSVLGAGSFLVFTFSDLARLGFGPSYLVLLGLRLAMFVGTLAFAGAIRRDPTVALSWRTATAIEAGVLSILLVVMALRPAESQLNNLGIGITLVACFLLVPNRFSAVVVMGSIAVVADVVIAAVVYEASAGQRIAEAFAIASFLVIGALSANQLQRARREEFLSLRHELHANDRLVGEISRRRVLENELTWLATHDPLTDLLNRRAFYERAEFEAHQAQETDRPLSILVIDADEFKKVNDRYGHTAGDEALRQIAAICKEHLRAGDIVGRVGGEEFAVVMPGAPVDLAERIAERLCAAVAGRPLEHADGPIRLSVSIGVTEYRVWQEAVTDGIQRADEGMYLAKSTGRNRVVGV